MNGTIVGLSTALPFAATTSKPILAVIIFVSLIVFLLAVFINRTDHIPLFLTVLVPGMAYLLILSCFIQQDFLAYGRMLGALTFLPWFIQVYIQLPSYKNLLRMNTARFAYLEKMSSLLTYQLSQAAILWLHDQSGFVLNNLEMLEPFLVFFAIGLVTLSAATMFRHFYLYYPISSHAKSEEDLDERTASIEAVAKKYGLSKGETQVFSLLAQGYSGPYIEKALFISKGTTKTYSYRIYRKLNINSQDELIELSHCSNEP